MIVKFKRNGMIKRNNWGEFGSKEEWLIVMYRLVGGIGATGISIHLLKIMKASEGVKVYGGGRQLQVALGMWIRQPKHAWVRSRKA
jgi:hypothetical protein